MEETANSRFDVLDAVPDGVLLVRRDGTIAYANGVAGELFGYTRGELLELQLEALLPEQSRAMHVRHRDGFLDDPHVRPMGQGLELKGLRKDGTEFPVDIHLSTLAIDDGVMAICAVRDISGQKLLQLDLEEALAESGAVEGPARGRERGSARETGIWRNVQGDSRR